MAANAEATVTLSLIDKVTGPIRRIGARIAGLSRSMGLGRINDALNGVGAGFKRLGAGIISTTKRLGALGTIGVAGVTTLAGAMIGVVKHTAEAGKEIKNLASIAGMGVVDFQKQSYAVGSVGISMEKYADILKDVSDKTGEYLATGGGEMKDFFQGPAKKAGVTAKMFKGLSSEQALGLYVKTLQKAKLSQKEMTFYMEALANDATGLLPLFLDNAKGLNELANKAGKFGVLGDSAIASLAKMNESFRETMGWLSGIKNEIGARFAPVVTEVVNALNRWIEANRQLISVQIQEWASRAADVIRDLQNPTSELRQRIDQVIQGFRDFVRVIGEAYDRVKPFVDYIGGPLVAALGLIGLWALAPVITAVTLLATSFLGLGRAVAGLSVSGVRAFYDGVTGLFEGGAAAMSEAGMKTGAMWGKAFSIAARAAIIAGVALATAELLQVVDPSGNLWGMTSGMDNAIREWGGLPKSDTGVTPGELYQAIKNRMVGKDAAPKAPETPKPPETLSPVARNLGFDQSPIFGDGSGLKSATSGPRYGAAAPAPSGAAPGTTVTIPENMIVHEPKQTTVSAPFNVGGVTVNVQGMTPEQARAAVEGALRSSAAKQAAAVESSFWD